MKICTGNVICNNVRKFHFVEIPEDGVAAEVDSEEEADGTRDAGEQRISIRASDKRVARDDEFSDSEDEGEGGRRDARSHKKMRKSNESDAKPPPNVSQNGETPEEVTGPAGLNGSDTTAASKTEADTKSGVAPSAGKGDNIEDETPGEGESGVGAVPDSASSSAAPDAVTESSSATATEATPEAMDES